MKQLRFFAIAIAFLAATAAAVAQNAGYPVKTTDT